MNGVQVPALDIDARMLENWGVKVGPRGRLERRIVANLIDILETAGFKLCAVSDGYAVTDVSAAKEAMELIFNLDEANVYFKTPLGKKRWVLLVLGNGIDVVSDYSYSPRDGFGAVMDAFDPEVFA